MAVIKTENLTYVYGEGTPFRKTAVDNVNIEINDGEMVGIIGHTGSGKSTLIQHFNGLLKPTSGSVYIDGERLWDDKSRLRPIRFKVGLVFQYPEYQLFEETCYKDIAKNVSKILVMNESKLFCYDDTVKVFHRSEELVSMGLAVPQITRVINRLKAMGIDIKDDVYTVGYAKKVILEMLEQKKNK